MGIPELLLLLWLVGCGARGTVLLLEKMGGKSQKHTMFGKKAQSVEMRRENSLNMSSIRVTAS